MNIEVDTATRVALRKSLQFQCPNCSGFLPTSLLKGGERPVPRIAINRNLIILGSAALLILGGIGYFLASSKTGDTNTTTQHIRNEIINNSYFQNLVVTGVANRSDLETIKDIRPYGDGFIGASTDTMEWDKAVALAMRTGAVILDISETADLNGIPVETWLSNMFPDNDIDNFWIKMDGQPAAFKAGQAVAINRNDGVKRVLLGWATPSVIPSVPTSSAPVPPAATTPAPRSAARMFIRTYSIPIEQWMDISPMLAQDHSAILEKWKAAANDSIKDKAVNIHNIGGTQITRKDGNSQIFHFPSTASIPSPMAFRAEGVNLVESEIQHRDYGSVFESGASEGDQQGTSRLYYSFIAKPPMQLPMLASGTPDQMRVSEVPVLEPLRLQTSIPTGLTGTHLVGATPMMALGEKPDKLALVFVYAEQEEPVAKPPSVTVEFMLMRGISGIPQDQVPTRIKGMASNPGGIEAVTVLSAMVGGKGLISGETEWPYPTEARMTGSVLVPMHLGELNSGTCLEIRCHATNTEGADVEFLFEHNLRKPSLPVASGSRPPYLEPANVSLFRITHLERRQIAHEWTAVKEFPLEPILGTRDARGKSCYLYARVISGENSILEQPPTPTIDNWIDSQGREIQGRFLRLEGETLVIEFKEKETRIPLSRLSAESRTLAIKRQSEMNP